ncbi:MAG TPA: MBL fold metallo-hydrolase [Negativicutes bacterium]|nr:MBL fold metallo-hydrolase [Negativicutes bacterium]
MKITFWGAAHTVTGSCYLLEAGGMKLLIDCGMFQGGKTITLRNERAFPFRVQDIDHVLLTHAHIDHSGLIPKLCNNGFRGSIIATEATKDLCGIMLPDSGHIQEVEAEWQNRKGRRRGKKAMVEPIYTLEDAERSLKFFTAVRYGEEVQVGPDIRACFRDAGHILGSAIIEIWVREEGTETKLVFSGDLGKYKQPIINNPTAIENADYVFIESTYGSRRHATEDRVDRLREVINDTAARGGNIVIPAFAVGRTQTLMYYLNQLLAEKAIPQLPIFVDSPLAIAATEIFARHPELYNSEARDFHDTGDDLFEFPGLKFTRTTEASMAINNLKMPAIIISANGMATAGRILHHLKHNLWRPESTVLFIGYQAEGTMGRHILEGADHVRIMGEDIAVRARIESIDGFSAHADQQELLTWIRQIKAPRMTFLMHGEDDVLAVFSQFLQTELGLKTYAPRYGDTVVLGKEGWQVSAQREQIIGGDLGELYATLSAVEEAYRRYREQLEQTLREHPDQAAAAKRKLTKMQRYMQKTLGEI